MRRERPQHFRADINWPVTLQHAQGDMEGETLNCSTINPSIRCSKALRLNEVSAMTIDAPDRGLVVNAEVVWSNIHGRDDKITPRGMGVRLP